ncbi:hypothetical protein BV898_06232 [Hypsibius exemplaris]|uniref:Uncharacterized protein n=1 Tax=Hypsibius exemplaris TaxID=2072580 RepID=A0A1W0WWW3_HYPEX|nr:hypothetical protein BV898_06232 [Hypsibius exemplaris]
MRVLSLLFVVLLYFGGSCHSLDLQQLTDTGRAITGCVSQTFRKEADYFILGHHCHFLRTAGFFRWKWTYDGHLSCGDLGTFSETGTCLSRGCALEKPLRKMLLHLFTSGQATKMEVIAEATTASDLEDLDRHKIASFLSAL